MQSRRKGYGVRQEMFTLLKWNSFSIFVPRKKLFSHLTTSGSQLYSLHCQMMDSLPFCVKTVVNIHSRHGSSRGSLKRPEDVNLIILLVWVRKNLEKARALVEEKVKKRNLSMTLLNTTIEMMFILRRNQPLVSCEDGQSCFLRRR